MDEEQLPPIATPKQDDELHLVDPGPKRKSKFWSYYKAYDLDHHPEKQHTARCILCGKDISVKQGTGGLVRHLQHRHADESEELAAISASYPAPSTLPKYRQIDVQEAAVENNGDDEVIIQPSLRKKARVSVGIQSHPVSVEILEAKIKREEHNLKMWKDSKEQLKQLKEELKRAESEADIEELEADIEGFKKRKAAFAKLLGIGEERTVGV